MKKELQENQKLSKKTVSKALEKSKELGENATEKEQAELEEKLPLMKHGVVKKVWDKVLFLWEKVKSPEIPAMLKITILGALLYLVLPLDILPDYIPGLGLLDDVSVILIVFREVSRFVLPKVEKQIEQKAYDSIYKKVDKSLNQTLFSMIMNTIWTFLANVTGCVILVAKPFGTPYSRQVALVIFALVFAHTLVRMAIYLKKYGRTAVKITKAIFHEKSISRGAADFVKTEYPYISRIYAGIEVAQNIMPELPQIPDLEEIAQTFEAHYKKRIILTAVIFALYTLLIWGTKVLLIHCV